MDNSNNPEIFSMLARAADLIAKRTAPIRTCLTCCHFKESPDPAQEFCGKYGIRPPARVIVNSCPEWQNEPF